MTIDEKYNEVREALHAERSRLVERGLAAERWEKDGPYRVGSRTGGSWVRSETVTFGEATERNGHICDYDPQSVLARNSRDFGVLRAVGDLLSHSDGIVKHHAWEIIDSMHKELVGKR